MTYSFTAGATGIIAAEKPRDAWLGQHMPNATRRDLTLAFYGRNVKCESDAPRIRSKRIL